MKSNRRTSGIHAYLLRYFLTFVAIMIALLWIFQIYFMDSTYKAIRSRQVRNTAYSVAALIDGGDSEQLEEISRNSEVTTVIIDTVTRRIYMSSNMPVINSIFRTFTNEDIRSILNYVSDKDDTLIYYNGMNRRITEDSFSLRDTKRSQAIMHVSRLNGSQNNYLLLVIGTLLPVTSTITTIRSQLIIITVIMFVFSVLLSIIVSRRISKPIEELTGNVEKMATGNYDVVFEGRGYQEIENLTDKLNETTVQLKRVDQVTKDLIANVSHDLRTPLTMISGYGEIIRDVPGENTPENVQVIIDEANRLTSLVNNLLDISKLQSGTAEINFNDVNVSELAARTYNTYSKMMEAHGYNFVFDADTDDIYVKGDSQRLEQVFYNLLNNAVAHIGEDKTIILKCRRKGDRVRFEVIDHGEGIAREDLNLIWQRYYKADKQARVQSGSGLGLSIVKTILDLHKAEYGVESEINQGADFWFELPVVEGD
ncbi:MAG: HAMP domain-containing histidine kinase [Erysipelotrichaceae bacterium]|nr:HAMP domain-containing histidine kinase [Erysipelotrichaceae bacterium]